MFIESHISKIEIRMGPSDKEKKTDKAWQDRDNHRDRVFRYRDNSQSVCVFCRRDGY